MKAIFSILLLILVIALSGCVTIEQLQNRYENQSGVKAFAIASNEKAGASWRQSTLSDAINLAIYYCRNSGGEDCRIVNLNGNEFNLRPITQELRPSNKREYRCSELALGQAYKLLQEGHYYLDADNDGHPCEWKSYVYRWRPKNSSSSCHWVSGYTRKDGTYVKDHRRCR